MGDVIKVEASVVSRKGIVNIANSVSYYMNGKFLGNNDSDDIQVSIEDSSKSSLFAICTGMEGKYDESENPVSMTNEIGKLHDKIKDTGLDISGILSQLSERVDETANLIYSLKVNSLGVPDSNGAFAGIIFHEGKAVGINIGKNHIALLRNGELTHLTVDYSEPSKLLKMGLINDEQAVNLSGKTDDLKNDGRKKLTTTEILKVKKGDVFVLYTNELAENVEEKSFKEILSSSKDSDKAAYDLIQEAVKCGANDDVAALVVKVTGVYSDMFEGEPNTENENKVSSRWSDALVTMYEKKQEAVRAMTAAMLTCIILVAMIILAFKMWSSRLDLDDKNRGSLAQNPVQSSQPVSTQSSAVQNTAAQNTPSTVTARPTTTGSYQTAQSTQTVKPSASPSSTNTQINYVTHVVQPGDNLMKISRKYYYDETKYKKIMEFNEITDPNSIYVGQILRIPSY